MLPKARLAPRIFLIVALIYGFIWVSGFPRTYDEDELPPNARPKRPESTAPPPYAVDADQIVWAVKTTATQAYAKLPSLLLLTHGAYYGTLLLLGDLQMDIGPFRVHDVLDRVPGSAVTSKDELARYKQQVDFAAWNRDIKLLKQTDEKKENEILARLEMYKWMRTLQRAWDLLPERSWYVFADDDTYLVRPNLVGWLGLYDSDKKHFFSGIPDANSTESTGIRGNTFILSKKAMKGLFTEREGLIATWESRLTNFATGYELMIAALSMDLNLESKSTWPSISGFHPLNVPYGPEMWCEPVVSMQSVPPELASEIWLLQREREEFHHVLDPLTFADLWQKFVQPEKMSNAWDDWNNLSSGPENAKWNILFKSSELRGHATGRSRNHARADEAKAQNGEASWESCRESCDNHEHCVQYSYSSVAMPNYNENGKTHCHLSRSMRLGHYVSPPEAASEGEAEPLTWKSGWRRDRFERWMEQQRCKGHQN